MPGLPAGEMQTLLRIERPVADEAFDGAGSGDWEAVDEVWASVQDALPSRSEKLSEGINLATRPSRVRMYFRDDVSSAMRFVDITEGTDGRIMQIVSGPAKIGNREGLEFMVEDYSVAGNPA